MSVIVLAGSAEALARWQAQHPTVTHDGDTTLFVVGPADLPARLKAGRWRIVRRDAWRYDERVVDRLRLYERPGVELIDPTGLLGGSRTGGVDTMRTEADQPATSRLARRLRIEPPPKRRMRNITS